MGPYLVISSDCHAGPPAELYRGYMDPAYRDQYEPFLASLATCAQSWVRPSPLPGKVPGQDW